MSHSSPERAFLMRVAELLHTYGTPAHRLERVLQKVATGLRVDAAFLSTPTSLFATFGRGADEEVHLMRVDTGEVNLGKLIEFDEVMEDVEHGRQDALAALERLDAIAASPPRWNRIAKGLAFGGASAGAARFLGGDWAEIGLSCLIGGLIFLLGVALQRRSEGARLYEPLAAFLAALASLFVAVQIGGVDDRIVTLASLIVLVPGLSMTVGLTELATRHLVSGVARLAGAGTVFLTLLLGVALAWRIGEGLFGAGAPPHAIEQRTYSLVLALLTAPIAFGVILDARAREFPLLVVTGVLGYLAARLGAQTIGPDLGPFLGAFVVGLASNLYARVCDRPASVPSTPGILLLVPGSLGYKSLTSFLDRQALVGIEWAFQTGLVAVSLVGGLLAANVALPPRRIL